MLLSSRAERLSRAQDPRQGIDPLPTALDDWIASQRRSRTGPEPSTLNDRVEQTQNYGSFSGRLARAIGLWLVFASSASPRAGLLSTNAPYVEVGGFVGGEAEKFHGLTLSSMAIGGYPNSGARIPPRGKQLRIRTATGLPTSSNSLATAIQATHPASGAAGLRQAMAPPLYPTACGTVGSSWNEVRTWWIGHRGKSRATTGSPGRPRWMPCFQSRRQGRTSFSEFGLGRIE